MLLTETQAEPQRYVGVGTNEVHASTLGGIIIFRLAVDLGHHAAGLMLVYSI